jgi:hypothetical protein
MSMRGTHIASNRLTKLEEKEHNKRVTKPNMGSSRDRAMISIEERDGLSLESKR